MSNDPWYFLTMAASNLKAAVPEQYEALERAFQLVATKETKALLAAEGEQLPRAQGRANLALEIGDRLAHCMEQRKNYENRR